MHKIDTQQVIITCNDQVDIYGTTFCPKHSLKGAILLGPATGIKRQFYASFAAFLAENGYGVLTFDNRGIGQSLQGSIKKNNATIQSGEKKICPRHLSFSKRLFQT